MSVDQTINYDAAVGANLRSLRLSCAIKQTELAARLGVQRAAVTRWEQGTRGLTVDMLLRIADTLGIPASRLLPDLHQEHAVPIALLGEAPCSLEERAIASILQVLGERPDLIIAVMQFLEQQALAAEHDSDAGY